MTPERYQRVYAAFEAVLKWDPAGRADLLERLCVGDPAMRAEVERLLAQHAEAEQDRFMATPAWTPRDRGQKDESTEGESEPIWSRSQGATGAHLADSETMLPPGLIDHPEYRIKRELGRGGMGVVYLAENRLTGRDEVLKVMARPLMESPAELERFLREIRAVAKLRHPNIVTAYHASWFGDRILFVMEYVEGLDLSRLVRARGPLPVANSCNYVHQAALGLQHAHEHGLVHRDIKPSNLMLTREGDRALIMVLDFGLAKVPSDGAADGLLTLGGQVLGTPAYMAPEQIRDARQADIRADIYSLGCTLYYLLTGDPPFRGASLYEILQAHQSVEATPLNLARPEAPLELAALVARMMAKDPERRFQEPREVARALTPFFKKSAVSTAGTITEFSRTRSVDGRAASAVAAPVSTQLADGSLPVLESRGGATAPQSRPRPIREGPIGSEEAEDSWDAAQAIAKTRRSGRTWIPMAATVGITLVGLIVAWAAWAFLIGPRKGVLVLENVPANCVVEVDGMRAILTQLHGSSVQIGARPGDHVVSVKQGDRVLLFRRVTLESGRASRLPMPRAAMARDRDAAVVPKKGLDRRAKVVERDRGALPRDRANGETGPPLRPPGSAHDGSRDSAPLVASPIGPVPARPPSDRPAVPPPRMELVRIEGNDLLMGSPDDIDLPDDEKPQRKVRIRAFLLSKFEVTQEQYQAVMRATPSHFSATGRGRREVEGLSTALHPVENVSWFDAIRFCNALSQLEKLPPYYQVRDRGAGMPPDVRIVFATGRGYRLPTEAEWECACRARTTTRFAFEDDPPRLMLSAWFDENAEKRTHPVGEKQENGFGLFDMYGNVAEWCWDGYAYPYQDDDVDNPRGPSEARNRVVRGGSWRMGIEDFRPALRGSLAPTARNEGLGFRVAKYE